jgi:hypothetical protein
LGKEFIQKIFTAQEEQGRFFALPDCVKTLNQGFSIWCGIENKNFVFDIRREE